MSKAMDWEKIWQLHGESLSLNPGRRIRYKAIIKSLKPGNTLDFGAGDGELAFEIGRLGIDVVGIEFSSAAVKRAEQKARILGVQNCVYHISNIDEIHGSYDNIIISEVIEHLDSPELLLSKLGSYLKTNGQVIVTTPAGPISYFDKLIGHRRHFDFDSIRKLAERSNLKLSSFHLIGFPVVNIVRLFTILRGKRIERDLQNPSKYRILNTFLTGFIRIIEPLTSMNTRFGWQIVTLLTLREVKVDD